MRYLLILGLLALTCSAFAATSGSGIVSLTIDKFVSIGDSTGGTITLINNDQTGTTDISFPYIANCPATITPSIIASSSAHNEVWSLGSGAVAGSAPGGSAVVTVNVGNNGSQLLAGTGSCTVQADIVANP